MKFLKNVNNGILMFYAISSAIVLGILTDWYDKQNFFGGMSLVEHYGLIIAVFLILASVFLMILKWLALYEEQNSVEDKLGVSFLVAGGCSLLYPFAIFKLIQLMIKYQEMYIDEKVFILLGFVLLAALGISMTLVSVRGTISVKERFRNFDAGDITLGSIFVILLLVKLMPTVMLNSAWLIVVFSIILIRTVYLFFVLRY